MSKHNLLFLAPAQQAGIRSSALIHDACPLFPNGTWTPRGV